MKAGKKKCNYLCTRSRLVHASKRANKFNRSGYDNSLRQDKLVIRSTLLSVRQLAVGGLDLVEVVNKFRWNFANFLSDFGIKYSFFFY